MVWWFSGWVGGLQIDTRHVKQLKVKHVCATDTSVTGSAIFELNTAIFRGRQLKTAKICI